MSGPFQTGQHPDADSLAAFLEGVLPEHEQAACLAHFADCARCREIAFAAQEPVPVSRPVRERRRWFAPIPVFASAAAVCTVGAALWFYAHRAPERPAPRAPEIVVQKAPAPVEAPPTAPPPVVAGVRTRQTRPPYVEPKVIHQLDHYSPDSDAPDLIVRGSISTDLSVVAESAKPNFPQAPVLSGTVTDPSGAAVPDADIAVRPAAGGNPTNAHTDPNGKFQIASLPAGRYELRIQARGFRSEVRELDLQPQKPIQVASVLNVGSVSETVEVTAATGAVNTTAATSVAVGDLPVNGRTAFNPVLSAMSATIGKISLAISTDGALHLSRNAEKTWTTVKTPWKDEAVELIKLSDPEQFQITTRSGGIWLSRDGTHWRSATAAPPKKK
jgi:hypothetical protein